MLCLGGKIVSVGKTKDALRDPWLKKNRKKVIEIDCAGQVVAAGICGFAHASRVHELRGWLILKSARPVRPTKKLRKLAAEFVRAWKRCARQGRAALAEKVLGALHEMAEQGTTTVEAKSGYGLTVDSELKSLAAIRQAASEWPGTVISTLLGAHVVPAEFRGRSQKYVEDRL